MCLVHSCKIHSQFHWSQGKSHMICECHSCMSPISVRHWHCISSMVYYVLKCSSMKVVGLGRKQLFGVFFFSRGQEIRHLDVLKQCQAQPLSWRDHTTDEMWTVVCQVGNAGLQLKILRSVEKLNWMFAVFYCNSFHVELAWLIGIDQFSLDGLNF